MELSLAFDASDTIEGLLDKAKTALSASSQLCFHEPALEARLLLEHAMGKSHTWLITHGDECVEVKQLTLFKQYVKERLSGKPVSFILGTQDFWSLRLNVSPCTLIPRQDTEVLVETALSLAVPEKAKVLDLGTGTGAVALALASEKPEWLLTGLDKIPEAVELAKTNAQLNKLKVCFKQSDWFSALNSDTKFDLIVSNPPYVEENNECLTQGDVRYEPLSALTSGADGLNDIRYIIEQAPLYMNSLAWIAFEHGYEQAQSIRTLLSEKGFIHAKTYQDYNNLDRVTVAQYLS